MAPQPEPMLVGPIGAANGAMRLLRLLLPLMLFGLVSCASSDDVAAARAAVVILHQELDDGQFDVIYDAGGQDLKEVSSRENFKKMLDRIHSKLGLLQSSSEMNWRIVSSTRGTFITLLYNSAYAGGPATEEFSYRIEDGKASLAGYHIHADALGDARPTAGSLSSGLAT